MLLVWSLRFELTSCGPLGHSCDPMVYGTNDYVGQPGINVQNRKLTVHIPYIFALICLGDAWKESASKCLLTPTQTHAIFLNVAMPCAPVLICQTDLHQTIPVGQLQAGSHLPGVGLRLQIPPVTNDGASGCVGRFVNPSSDSDSS